MPLRPTPRTGIAGEKSPIPVKSPRWANRRRKLALTPIVLFILSRPCQNIPMRYWALSLAFIVWCSLNVSAQAGSRCHDPSGREAAIGGDTISGIVFQNGKLLRHAQVKVYFSTGKTSWVWRTDQEGKFTTPKLRRGAYRVDITGRGSAVVKVGSQQERLGEQTINWTVDFGDDGCVGIGMSTD